MFVPLLGKMLSILADWYMFEFEVFTHLLFVISFLPPRYILQFPIVTMCSVDIMLATARLQNREVSACTVS